MENEIKHIQDSEFEKEVLLSKELVLVDFWAPWCGPCKGLMPVLHNVAEKYNGKVKFVKVNVDEDVEYAKKFNVRGIPNLILFKNGEILEQIVGAVPQNIIENLLDKFL